MIKAIAITGPTASGKTSLSLSLSRELGCEIISMDSMQIYRGMDIGTAKATPEERAIAPHHMLDVASPSESFSANDYREMALPIARDIEKRGMIPLFVGGTGLYLSTLTRAATDRVPPACPKYRQAIMDTLITEDDRIALWKRLEEIDPQSAAAVHYNNTRRVIRAIEIYEKTGMTKSYFDMLSRQNASDIDILHITLDFHDREILYKRIDERVDLMLEGGLVREVSELYGSGRLTKDSTAAQAIGYKEIIDRLASGEDLSGAVDAIKQASRNYAKRQLTWFRHEAGVNTLFADCEGGGMKSSEQLLLEALGIIKEQFSRV